MKNEYEIRGEITVIFIKRKDGTVLNTMIDTEDLNKLIDHKYIWSCSSGYCYGNHKHKNLGPTEKKQIGLSRFIMGDPPGMYIDHINHDTLDNRKCNLRIVTNSENQQNRINLQSNNTSGYQNVYWKKSQKKWMARLRINRKEMIIGYFDSPEKANEAALKAKKVHHPFANSF